MKFFFKNLINMMAQKNFIPNKDRRDYILRNGTATRVGTNVFYQASCNYKHIFGAIDEVCDNIQDAATESKGRTSKASIDATLIGENDVYMLWTFCNNGNPIDKTQMENAFCLAMSEKVGKNIIGKYGIGLKAVSDYLGDALLMISYNPMTSMMCFGYYNHNMLLKNDIRRLMTVIFEHNIDLKRPTPETLDKFNIICQYTHFNDWKEIVMFGKDNIKKVGVYDGGTLTTILTSKETYGYIIDDKVIIDVEKKDIVAIKAWNEDFFENTGTKPPLFATSYAHHLSVLYRNTPYKVDFYLFGKKIEQVNPATLDDMFVAKRNISKRAPKYLNWLPGKQHLKQTTAAVNSIKSAKEEYNKDYTSYITLYSRIVDNKQMSNSGELFGNFNGFLVYNNNRLITVHNFVSNSKKHIPGFGIIDSFCLKVNQSKQVITDNTVFRISISNKVLEIYTQNLRSIQRKAEEKVKKLKQAKLAQKAQEEKARLAQKAQEEKARLAQKAQEEEEEEKLTQEQEKESRKRNIQKKQKNRKKKRDRGVLQRPKEAVCTKRTKHSECKCDIDAFLKIIDQMCTPNCKNKKQHIQAILKKLNEKFY